MNQRQSNFVERWKARIGWGVLPTPVDLSNPTEGAADDAQVLIAFAAQSQRTLDETLLKQLVDSRGVVVAAIAAKQSLTSEEQTNFWSAYGKAASAMAPLSAHSIRSSMRINAKRGISSLITPTAGFAIAAIAVFLGSIFVQSYWVAGKDLLEKADAIEKERADTAKQILLSRNARAITEGTTARLATKVGCFALGFRPQPALQGSNRIERG